MCLKFKNKNVKQQTNKSSLIKFESSITIKYAHIIKYLLYNFVEAVMKFLQFSNKN